MPAAGPGTSTTPPAPTAGRRGGPGRTTPAPPPARPSRRRPGFRPGNAATTATPTPKPGKRGPAAAGFQSGYGDYDGIAITNTGKSVTVAGEGVSFTTGPGAIWMNRMP